MSTSVATSADPGKLRPLLHAELDRLSDGHLGLPHRALLEIELHQVAGELDDSADAAKDVAKLTIESIAGTIAEHRASRPYR